MNDKHKEILAMFDSYGETPVCRTSNPNFGLPVDEIDVESWNKIRNSIKTLLHQREMRGKAYMDLNDKYNILDVQLDKVREIVNDKSLGTLHKVIQIKHIVGYEIEEGKIMVLSKEVLDNA